MISDLYASNNIDELISHEQNPYDSSVGAAERSVLTYVTNEFI